MPQDKIRLITASEHCKIGKEEFPKEFDGNDTEREGEWLWQPWIE